MISYLLINNFWYNLSNTNEHDHKIQDGRIWNVLSICKYLKPVRMKLLQCNIFLGNFYCCKIFGNGPCM